MKQRFLLACLVVACVARPAWGNEPVAETFLSPKPALALSEHSEALLSRTLDGVEATLATALEFLGIRYRRGGATPETGFDCSGFVRYVFTRTLGLDLPRSAKAMSQRGEPVVDPSELKPGDLVFFNTMRRAFSHVGIYLGDGWFVHAPRAGGRVRIESIHETYWSRRYNGARRLLASDEWTSPTFRR
ncbi:MAG: C40 family peptidase [Rhodocyclaceae bacterium]|nr:C40 family peptidase [Rhodocyclaceae bacterium]